jgi:hypothetical protein
MQLRIILLDDVPENRDEVLDALRQALGARGEVAPFAPGVGGVNDGMTEKRIAADLKVPPNAPLSLIVADRDLSRIERYGGLSESTVRQVADSLGTPECGYARGERDDDDEYIERGEHREACIRLSLKPSIDEFAARTVSIAEGFAFILELLSKVIEGGGKKSPGRLLATILGKPDYADKISLFASGDQSRLESLLRLRKSEDDNERRRRLSCLLGYWLWDSVLRFPGVVMNEVATASYLDIDETDFCERREIQLLYVAARYDGPFAGAKPSLWWRGIIDEIVSNSGCVTGREFAQTKLGVEVRRSRCCENPERSAGYYCFLSGRPVSLENSKPGLPWFPRGADLARVSNSKFDELAPWL